MTTTIDGPMTYANVAKDTQSSAIPITTKTIPTIKKHLPRARISSGLPKLRHLPKQGCINYITSPQFREITGFSHLTDSLRE